MSVVLINPNLIAQRSDVFTTGIVYMPVGLSYFAAAVRESGLPCRVIDAFGENPNQSWIDGDFLFRGLTPVEVVERIRPGDEAVVLYAINLTYHRSLVQLVQAIRERHPSIKIAILENTQAVTAYSLRRIQGEFYEAGADFVITGEGEHRGVRLLQLLQQKASLGDIAAISGIGFRDGGTTHYTEPLEKIKELDKLPFPAWDLFPLQNYWNLKYAHGPMSSNRYLPILTSRGCPYKCRFCVIPETNDIKWRGRPAKNVVDEIEYLMNRFQVFEFHVEDVDPTVKDSRTREICEELLNRKIKIRWKLCSGTKVETMKSRETIQLMAKAGCDYISISPESGSPQLMKAIDKPFDLEHSVDLIHEMNQCGIYSQACFVLGFPGETAEDRRLSREMVHALTKAGVDEIAIFVVTPVPGSKIYSSFSGFSDYSQLNFSPTWRQDYEELNRFRVNLYRSFLLWKLRYHPLKILVQPFRFLSRRFRTKMEMVPYKALHTYLLSRGVLGKLVGYQHKNYKTPGGKQELARPAHAEL